MENRAVNIRWGELSLAAFAAVAFGAAVAALLPGVWPLMPFPETAPVEIVALLGFGFGFLLRRTWTLALPFTILVAIDPPQSGFGGSLIALLVLSPFATAGAFLGIQTGRALQRWMLRRTLKAARRPHRLKPPDTADAPITAARRQRVPVG